MAWPVLVFDIETIPDMGGWRRLHGVPEGLAPQASDAELFAHWRAQRAAQGHSDFMPLYLQRVLCISCVFRNAEGLRVHSFVDRDGESDREAKWNNYIGRYHLKHLALMDLLAKYTPRANAPLDALAKLCGFPGKLGMDGGQVYDQYLAGQLEDVRRYCETDVMNPYLLYCRFQKMRGGFTEAEYAQEIDFVRQNLQALAPAEPHWQQYLQAWA